MPQAASFSQRWAKDNLTRQPSPDELVILNLFPTTCESDEAEASRRARRYYSARGPGGLTELWHKRVPDDEDILSSCQDAYIVPLETRTHGGRRMTILRMPAPMALDRPLSAKALLARWLMLLDIRLREDPTPGEEVVIIDVSDLQPAHLKNHFRGSYWKDFVWLMKHVYPIRFTEVHVINAHRLKTMSLLLLHIGLYPWRRKVVQIHANANPINQVMGVDYFPEEQLPYEYGGKAGAMKDLNGWYLIKRFVRIVAGGKRYLPNQHDQWTKKLLSNSKWLHMEERKYYETVLKPETRHRRRHKSSVRSMRASNASYDMLTRTHSCRSLHRPDDLEEGLYGAYRTLRIAVDF